MAAAEGLSILLWAVLRDRIAALLGLVPSRVPSAMQRHGDQDADYDGQPKVLQNPLHDRPAFRFRRRLRLAVCAVSSVSLCFKRLSRSVTLSE